MQAVCSIVYPAAAFQHRDDSSYGEWNRKVLPAMQTVTMSGVIHWWSAVKARERLIQQRYFRLDRQDGSQRDLSFFPAAQIGSQSILVRQEIKTDRLHGFSTTSARLPSNPGGAAHKQTSSPMYCSKIWSSGCGRPALSCAAGLEYPALRLTVETGLLARFRIAGGSNH